MTMNINAESGDWKLFEEVPELGIRRYCMEVDGVRIIKTEMPKVVQDLMRMNAEQRAESRGTRWGDGAVVARIPLNIYFNELAEAANVGDDKYVNKWLNDADHAAFRTREGKL